MRTLSKNCSEHEDFLEQLASAEGQRARLPEASAGCEVCEANRERFLASQALLRAHGQGAGALLSADWQAEVWLRLGAELQPASRSVEQRVQDAAKIVRFPGTPARVELLAGSAGAAGSGGAAVTAVGSEPVVAPPKRVVRPWRSARVIAAAASVALLLTGAGIAGWLVHGQHEGAGAEHGAMPRTLWRGNHAVQPSNPPRLAARVTPQVKLKAYALGEDRANDDGFDSLRDGATIPSGARLSFDYATEAVGGELQYLTVVAVVRSQDAQARSLPEGKQLLWLVESRPVQDTGGHLNVLDDEDIRVDAPPGEMTIYGLVSRQPVPSQAIEDAFLLQSAGPVALPGVGVARLDLKVAAR